MYQRVTVLINIISRIGTGRCIIADIFRPESEKVGKTQISDVKDREIDLELIRRCYLISESQALPWAQGYDEIIHRVGSSQGARLP